MEVKIEHKDAFRRGIRYLCCTVILAVLFYFTRAQFASTEAVYMIIILAVELIVSLWFLIRGKSYEILNAEGITAVSLFQTVTYSWHQVEKYGVDMVPVKRGTKVYLSQTEPVISVYTDRKKFRLSYREDVMSCLAHYKGEPAYDKR